MRWYGGKTPGSVMKTISLMLPVPNYSQQDAMFLDLFISTDALHVTGGSSAHHQKHITVHTASDIVYQYISISSTIAASSSIG